MTPITIALIFLNIAAFIWLTCTGGYSDSSLVAHGAIYPWYVRAYGQWQRIVSGAFLHANLTHITMNMLALAQLGSTVEMLVGSLPMLWIYAASLVGSGIAVVFYSGNEVTVGASGAIYGLFGGLLAIGLRLGSRGRALVTQTLPVLIINLIFTYMVPNISISGHVGGLITGFAAAFMFNINRRSFTNSPPAY